MTPITDLKLLQRLLAAYGKDAPAWIIEKATLGLMTGQTVYPSHQFNFTDAQWDYLSGEGSPFPCYSMACILRFGSLDSPNTLLRPEEKALLKTHLKIREHGNQ